MLSAMLNSLCKHYFSKEAIFRKTGSSEDDLQHLFLKAFVWQ